MAADVYGIHLDLDNNWIHVAAVEAPPVYPQKRKCRDQKLGPPSLLGRAA